MPSAPRILIVANDPGPWRHQFDRDDVAVVFAGTPLAAIWHLDRGAFTSVVCGVRIGTLLGHSLLALVRDRWPSLVRVLAIDLCGASSVAIEAALASGAAQAVLTEGSDPVAIDIVLTLAGSARAAREIRRVARSREQN